MDGVNWMFYKAFHGQTSHQTCLYDEAISDISIICIKRIFTSRVDFESHLQSLKSNCLFGKSIFLRKKRKADKSAKSCFSTFGAVDVLKFICRRRDYLPFSMFMKEKVEYYFVILRR